MKKRYFFKQIMASLLLISMLFSLNSMNVAKAEEMDEDEDALYFEVNIEADNGSAYVGDFAIHNEALYVRDDTVSKMADDISDMSFVLGSKEAAFAIERGETRVEFAEEETWGNYLPFEKTLTCLSLHPIYVEETNTLQITETMNLTDLDKIMQAIYDEKAYDMAYWQASDEWGGYKAHVKLAAIADCVKSTLR